MYLKLRKPKRKSGKISQNPMEKPIAAKVAFSSQEARKKTKES